MTYGDKVTVHKQRGYIQKEYLPGMYEVRIWDGKRHVGDVVVPESEIKCGWCGERAATIVGLCATCYKLSA